MTEFNKTNWAKPEFSRQYRDNADIYIVERDTGFREVDCYYKYGIFAVFGGRKDNDESNHNSCLSTTCGLGKEGVFL